MITVGSTNPVKIDAVKEVVLDYPLLASMELISLDVSSGVSDQPLSLEEIIQGAKNRAVAAFDRCVYSFGIESGLFQAPGTKTGYLEACICCIFDGNQTYFGLSCGFEVPPKILSSVLQDKMDLTQACQHHGISSNPKLGSADGLIGLLTNGRINRKEYTKQCVKTALLQIENPNLY